jgi:lipid-binding SYLF domain-containing protein
MPFRIVAPFLVATLLAAGLASAGNSPDKKKEKTRKMAAQTLQDLYKLQPTSQAAIQKSAGYAVFNNVGANVLLLSTARGAGIAVNSRTKQETFMKMISAGAGLGMGVKDYRVVFVLGESRQVRRRLLGHGRGYPGCWVYQITKNGLALQLTLQGTKYYKDDDLNKS